MSEEVYLLVVAVCCFIIGMYAREKIEVLLKRRRKGEAECV
jgi:hypothetical protein